MDGHFFALKLLARLFEPLLSGELGLLEFLLFLLGKRGRGCSQFRRVFETLNFYLIRTLFFQSLLLVVTLLFVRDLLEVLEEEFALELCDEFG